MRLYLRELRINKNITQQMVADVVGITRQYYNMIETGERQKKLSIDMARKLADVFGVTFEYICAQENQVSDKEA